MEAVEVVAKTVGREKFAIRLCFLVTPRLSSERSSADVHICTRPAPRAVSKAIYHYYIRDNIHILQYQRY